MQLKRIRKEKGLSIAKLAVIADVPTRTIEDIERRGDCRVSTAVILAHALGVTMDELCIDVEKKLVD